MSSAYIHMSKKFCPISIVYSKDNHWQDFLDIHNLHNSNMIYIFRKFIQIYKLCNFFSVKKTSMEYILTPTLNSRFKFNVSMFVTQDKTLNIPRGQTYFEKLAISMVLSEIWSPPLPFFFNFGYFFSPKISYYIFKE